MKLRLLLFLLHFEICAFNEIFGLDGNSFFCYGQQHDIRNQAFLSKIRYILGAAENSGANDMQKEYVTQNNIAKLTSHKMFHRSSRKLCQMNQLQLG